MKNKLISLILIIAMGALLVPPGVLASEDGSITFYAELADNSNQNAEENESAKAVPVPLFNDVNEIAVLFCGSRLKFEQPPVNVDGRVLVPMRGIFEAMGMEVLWDEGQSKVTATMADKTIELTIGESVAYVNSEAIALDTPAKIISGHTMVPVRFVAESSGYRVHWDTKRRPMVVILPEYPDEVYASLQSLVDECYSEDILNWIINLYDPETSAFYFKKSAKETEGFYPDRESTSKCLRMLEYLGVIDTNNLSEVYTEDMIKNLTAFAQADQSDEDGLWYEKPWGKYANESKLHYASGSAGQVLKMVGAKPLYLTEDQRLAQSTQGEETLATSELYDNKFNSLEDFEKWIENDFDWSHPYASGSRILSNLGTIRTAGDDYYDLMVKLVFEKISPNTGLLMTYDPETDTWLELVNNDAMSGTYKVSAAICESHWPSLGGRDYAMPYFDKAIRSTIDVVLGDEANYHACDIANAWVLFRHLLESQNNINDVPEYKAAYEYFVSRLPDLLDKTKERILSLKTEDGSYTYYSGKGSAQNQGVLSSLYHCEGELSGASMIIDLLDQFYITLFMDAPNPLGDKYGPEDIREMLLKVEPTKKIEFATQKTYTFDDYELGTFTNLDGMRASGDVSIAEDKEYWGEKAVRIHNPGGTRPILTFDVGTTAGKGYTLEFDAKFESDMDGQSLMLVECGSWEYATLCSFRKQNGSYLISRSTDKSATVKQGFDWTDYHTIKIVYNVNGDEATTDYYFDGQLINSGGYYTNTYPVNIPRPPVQNIPCINFRPDHETPFTMYIDNLTFTQHE